MRSCTRALRALLEQAGYEVSQMRGVPAPYPLAIGENRWSRMLLKLNTTLLKISKRVFAYQICIRARPRPQVSHLLQQTISGSARLRAQLIGRVA